MVSGVRVRAATKPEDLNNNKSNLQPVILQQQQQQQPPQPENGESSESESDRSGASSSSNNLQGQPARSSSRKQKERFIIADNDDEVDYHREHRIGESLVNDAQLDTAMAEAYLKNKVPFEAAIVWRNVFTMVLLHVLGFYGWWYCIRYAHWQTVVFAYIIGHIGGIGILAGAHRLWTHRSYKAHWSVRTLLMLLQTLALQNDIYEWVRDHRTHHKYSETDADPHNSKRGFFFAHVGWLLCRKHPLVKEKGAQIDMSDVWADPLVRFQRRFYIPLVLLVWGVFPVSVPVYFWSEPVMAMVFGNFFRYIVSLHQAWLVNSAAHLSGGQFYDKALQPRENRLVTYLSMGEGYHNYHHTFPWDYSASEHGWRDNFNLATAFIDLCAALGLVTDRRVVSKAVVEARIARTGDRSLLPPYYAADRTPKYKLLDIGLGLCITSWSLWLTFVLRLLV